MLGNLSVYGITTLTLFLPFTRAPSAGPPQWILAMQTGVGASPQNGDFVVVDWVAYLSDGTVFDNTTSPGRNPVVFQMGQRKVRIRTGARRETRLCGTVPRKLSTDLKASGGGKNTPQRLRCTGLQ